MKIDRKILFFYTLARYFELCNLINNCLSHIFTSNDTAAAAQRKRDDEDRKKANKKEEKRKVVRKMKIFLLSSDFCNVEK